MKIGEFFDRFFIHIFISGTHLFFIGLSFWLERFDLLVIGIIMFFISFIAFEIVGKNNENLEN